MLVPQDCLERGFQSRPLLGETSTLLRVKPELALTWPWTHHSLPRTRLKVASKVPGGGGGGGGGGGLAHCSRPAGCVKAQLVTIPPGVVARNMTLWPGSTW